MKHSVFVLFTVCFSVRAKVYLVETKDEPSKNNSMDSRGNSLLLAPLQLSLTVFDYNQIYIIYIICMLYMQNCLPLARLETHGDILELVVVAFGKF